MLRKGHALTWALLAGALLFRVPSAQSPRLGPTAVWLAHASRTEPASTQACAPDLRALHDRESLDGTVARHGAWVSLAAGLISATYACKFDVDARAEYDDRNRAYARYQGAYTSEHVHHWREQHDDAEHRGDAAVRRRNVASGIALACFGLSLSLWIWR